MKWIYRNIPILLVLAAFFMAGISIFVASQRDLTGLENTLLQAFSLAFGLTGSFLFGKQSAKEAAKEMIKPHARSAFRRLISLYESLSRVALEIENYKVSIKKQNSPLVIERLEAIVIEQLATADDALEDWNDIVPEEVSELKTRLLKPRNNENTDER